MTKVITQNLVTTRSTQSSVPTVPENLRTKCEVWTRVMGYHRPVSQFNKGKKSEHAERVQFIVE